jgi:hypothetical protein
VCKLAAPPGRAQSSFTLVEPATELREFWSRMRRDNQLRDDTSVIVVGDSLIDFALKLSAATLTEYLVVILSIPHHTYVFPDDVAWCFGYMMEDDAFFARRPSPARP